MTPGIYQVMTYCYPAAVLLGHLSLIAPSCQHQDDDDCWCCAARSQKNFWLVVDFADAGAIMIQITHPPLARTVLILLVVVVR